MSTSQICCFVGILLFVPGLARADRGVNCQVTASFSGEGSIGARLTQALREANQRITVALFGFNNVQLADELAKLAKKGVVVRLKVDTAKSLEKKTGGVVNFLKSSGVRVQTVAPDGRNHNKFAVIDRKRVITGSYNWTLKAEQNWENLLFLDCPELAEKYEREWERIR